MKVNFNKRPHRHALIILLITIATWTLYTFTTYSLTPDITVLDHLNKLGTIKFKVFSNGYKQELLDFDRSNLKVIYPQVIDELYNRTPLHSVDWSKLAYVFYATSKTHVCNVMIKCTELRKFGTRATLVVLVGNEFFDGETYPDEYKILSKFAQSHKVVLKPVEPIHIQGISPLKHSRGFIKLLAFNQCEFDRVIYMDSDSLIYRGHLDELFFIPPCKLAVVNGYSSSEEQFKRLNTQLGMKFDSDSYDYTVLTTDERQRKISTLIEETITPFLKHSKLSFRSSINNKNFYTNLYNSLPNDIALDEFRMSNMIMVIQPTDDLFQHVLRSFQFRTVDEFDLELLQNKIFPTRQTLQTQEFNSEELSHRSSFTDRLSEIPELLVLPHQRYGVLTSELNTAEDHISFMADTQDTPFALQTIPHIEGHVPYYDIHDKPAGDIIFGGAKYIHFSDSQFPKPWYKTSQGDAFMSERLRCDQHPDWTADDGRVKPKGKSEECTAGDHWEWIYKRFAELRSEVCGMPLLDVDEDPYE